ERRRQRALVEVLAGRQRRRGFDGVDADDGAAQTLLVGADARGEIGHRRLVAKLAAQRFARRIELTPLAPDAARPRILAERVDHRPADAALGKGLELDAALLVEAVRRIDQAEDAVLDEIRDVDRIRHRRRPTPGKRFNERQAGNDSAILVGGDRLGAHELSCLGRTRFASLQAVAPYRNGGTNGRACVPERATIAQNFVVSRSYDIT